MHNENTGRFITTREEWIQEYRKDKTKVWIIIELSDNVSYYFSDFKQWYVLNKDAEQKDLKVASVTLQFRSNKMVMKIPECDGIYLIRSALGSPGADTIDTITIGYLNKDKVLKRVIQLPALIETQQGGIDLLDNCFEEGILQWNKRKK